MAGAPDAFDVSAIARTPRGRAAHSSPSFRSTPRKPSLGSPSSRRCVCRDVPDKPRMREAAGRPASGSASYGSQIWEGPPPNDAKVTFSTQFGPERKDTSMSKLLSVAFMGLGLALPIAATAAPAARGHPAKAAADLLSPVEAVRGRCGPYYSRHPCLERDKRPPYFQGSLWRRGR
jgi:hypothetical protein